MSEWIYNAKRLVAKFNYVLIKEYTSNTWIDNRIRVHEINTEIIVKINLIINKVSS